MKNEIAESVLPASSGNTNFISDKIVCDEDVLHLWSLVSGEYIDDDEESMQLLKDITRLWVTDYKGFFSGSIMDGRLYIRNKEDQFKESYLSMRLYLASRVFTLPLYQE